MIIIKKLNIFKKGPAPYEAVSFRSGFAILFAVTLAAILLTIALGVANIAYKELKFGTSAQITDNAFFAADTGTECALFNDKSSSSSFPLTGPATPITCIGKSNTTTFSGGSNTALYSFTLTGLGSTSAACAKVTVYKDGATNPLIVMTTIISKGYDSGDSSCNSTNQNRTEREIKTTYGGAATGGIILGAVPVVTISANPSSGSAPVTPNLTWSATNSPTSCTASGFWAGSQPTAGNNVPQTTLNKASQYTYTLTCSNSVGAGAPATATVQVN